jgi:hypothetical protein
VIPASLRTRPKATVNTEINNDPKTKQFFLPFLGAGSSWALAAEDQEAVFFLVGSNPTVGLQKLNKLVKVRPKP